MDTETGIAFVLYGLVLLANVVIVAQHKAHIRELEKKVKELSKPKDEKKVS